MNKFSLYAIASILAGAVTFTSALAQGKEPEPPEAAEPQRPLMSKTIAEAMRNGHVLLNFENIDIRVLSRMMSELTGRNIIVDEKIKGKLTILSARSVSIAEAWDIYKAALNRCGFVVSDKGENVQILPGNTARSVGSFIPASSANPSGEEYVMAVMIMRQGNPEAVEKAVKPLLSENGIIGTYKDGLAILVADKASIVSRIGKIVKSLDDLEPSLKTEVVFPKYMEAEKVVASIKPLYTEREQKKEFAISAFAPSNAVLISAFPKDLQNIRRLLERLDIPMAAPTKTEPARFFVYNLQYAQAEDVAKILSDMLSERQKAVKELLKESKVPATEALKNEAAPPKSEGFADADAGRTDAAGNSEQPATTGFTSSKVSADKETNSLVLYVSPSEYDDIRSVIAKLDAERRQIQISAVVAEIALKRSEEMGIGWQAITNGGIIGSYKGGLTEEGLLNVLAGGNFVAGVVGSKTRSITVSNQTVDVPEFFAYLDALQSSNDFNLISAPRILTQDNKKATINVGQVVPFATGGKLDAFGSPTVTFDYREVGIKLQVTPHMSRTGKIRMDVVQEIQEVTEYLKQEMAGVSFSAPVVSNRKVETTVTIPDGKTLLIGGLISKRTSDTMKGIPILKDVPLIGWLFRDKTKDETKTNIFVSITPKIVDLDSEIEEQDHPLKPYLEQTGEPGDQQYENRDTLKPEPKYENGAAVPGDSGETIKISAPDEAKAETGGVQNSAASQAAPSDLKQNTAASPKTESAVRSGSPRPVFGGMEKRRVVYTNTKRKNKAAREANNTNKYSSGGAAAQNAPADNAEASDSHDEEAVLPESVTLSPDRQDAAEI